MAKRRHSNRVGYRTTPARRVNYNANPILHPVSMLPRRSVALALSQVDDRRRYHPHGSNRSYRRLDGRRVIPKVVISHSGYRRPNRRRRFPLIPDLKISALLPRDAVICARRRIRKQVIHALGHAGRGGQRRPNRSSTSDVKCER